MAAKRSPRRADLVLSGGGVKGIGLVGAVVALQDAGYAIERISGTSAGSLVGAVVAAAVQRNDLSGDQLRELALRVPYRKFRDSGPIESIPVLGTAWGLLRETGIYRGDFAYDWIRSHYTLDANANMPAGSTRQGLYYYFHVFAKALQAWGEPTVTDPQGNIHNWRIDLCRKLISLQRDDGSWVNDADRWNEGDPNYVTALAVLSLQAAMKP